MQATLTTKPNEKTRSHSSAQPAAESPLAAGQGVGGSAGMPLFLQPKLAISRPDDPAEQEADRVADQVMRMPEQSIQRQCAACEEEEAVTVSRKAEGSVAGEAPRSVHATLRSPGQPLSASTRAFFEPRFGRDLSQVRVHTDGEAQQSARDVNALAYTVGSHVVFGGGRYAPEAPDGQRLLAHELTHVVQQTRLSQAVPMRFGLSAPGRQEAGNLEPMAQVSRTPAGLTLQRECAVPIVADRERTVRVPYDPDFANFYRTVERVIGRLMVFRSDDGGRVRELTELALQEIHRTTSVRTGLVSLEVVLLRCSETRRVEDIRLREVDGEMARRERDQDPALRDRVISVTPGDISSPFVGVACYSESVGHMNRFIQDVERRLEYDEETARWNFNEGRDRGDWAQRLFDAWGHCYIAACMTRVVPEVDTWALGTFLEYFHEALSDVVGHDSLSQDLYNQAVGRQIGLDQPSGDLYEITFDAMMRGRLDLTLAGVPRGRALVPRVSASE